MSSRSVSTRLSSVRSRAGRPAALVCILLGLAGCASTGISEPEAPRSKDPWEPVNRVVFDANMKLDGWVVKPLAKGYQKVTPGPVERGVSNFFSNVGEVGNAINSVLQWKWRKAGNSSGRFLLNSTVGVVGLFDVAKHTGLKELDGESFGQTLSYWGVGAGPYLVLPFLGSSTVTDAIALPVDWYTDPLTYIEHQRVSNGLKLLGLLDSRVALLEAEKLMSGDRYIFVREAYLQRREFLVNDGVVEDDFGGDFDDFDGDF